MTPKRIQRQRTKDWRSPAGAVYVGRPSKWGNPILVSDVAGQYPSLSEREVATLVVRDFETLARAGSLRFPNWRRAGGQRGPVAWTYPGAAEIRAHLGGRDLVCWCPLDQPCHADVLLEIANEGSASCA